MALKFFKVSALPAELVANAVYFLKSDVTGMMELYMSDVTGASVRKLTGAAEVSSAITTALQSYDSTGASKLAEVFELEVDGDATGTVDIDGSDNVKLTLTLKNVGTSGEQAGIVTTDVNGRVVSSRAIAATDLPASITSDTSGNAATADKVNAAVTINGTAFDGSVAKSFTLVESSSIGVADGVAPLDSNKLIPAEFLPSYVDDVLEAANLAALPETGESGKIYVTVDNGNVYRWTGTQYIRVNDTVSTAEEALKLAEGFELEATGDATGTVNIDGSGDVELELTLKDVGTSGEQSGIVTTDSKGRVVSSRAIALSDLPAGITSTGIDFADDPEW